MGIIKTIYTNLLYQPLFNALILLYNIIPGHDFGIAIILITLLLRIILFPLSIKGLKSRKALEGIQVKVKEIQNKYQDKKEQAARLMNLYKENKVNPVSGCLPLLIQLPIIIALYRAFVDVVKPESLKILYPFIKNPGTLDANFLGIVDLSVPNVLLAVLAGVAQFFQGKIMIKTSLPIAQDGAKKANLQKALNSQMIYFMPVITVIFALKLPAGLPLYWAVSTLFGIGEYLLINRKKNGPGELNQAHS